MKSGRAALLILVALGVLAAPFASEAQQAGKVWRIGFLGPGSAERVYTDPLRSFRAGLRELGYAEGKSIVFEYRFAEDKYERLPGLAAELVRDKVDVIVVHSTPGTRAAKQSTSTIPIVMVAVADPVGAGLAASLARPGGNVTGVSNIDVGLAAKRLELLKELLAAVERLVIPHRAVGLARN
jgi:putative ABC transport system substrate-binding protein